MKWDYVASLALFTLMAVGFTLSPLPLLPALLFILAYLTKGSWLRGALSLSGVVLTVALLAPLTASSPYTPLPSALLCITSLQMFSSSLKEVEDPPWRVKRAPLLHTTLLLFTAIAGYYIFVNFTRTGMVVDSLPVGRVFLVGAATLLTAGLFLTPREITPREST